MSADRKQGIIDRLSDAESYDSIEWILENPVIENLALSVVDAKQRANMEFQAEAGLPATVRRTTEPDGVRSVKRGKKTYTYKVPCNWCKSLAGVYTYPDVPKDVWRRHDNCYCTIKYTPKGGKRIDYLSGRTDNRGWTVDRQEINNRKQFAGINTKPKDPKQILIELARLEAAADAID